MKTVVAIIVYNRIKNIERWIHCWNKSSYSDEQELVVIDNSRSEKIRDLCKGVTYISRQNVGFDIGAFQDVCRRRLKGFPDYDYLLWCTDDTYPMIDYFVEPFYRKITKPGVGLACMKISASVQPHVRTTGFMISRQVAEKLKFPADPVTSKIDCYSFEHRGSETLTNQVRQLGLACVQVAPDATSPLWDSGYHKRLDRLSEHEKTFEIKTTKKNKVVFVCTIFNTYPQIVSSLMLQTHQNWELILIHDGPSDMREVILRASGDDRRITFAETEKRLGNWGHELRRTVIDGCDLGDYVVVSNADNYYVPTFVEYMLKGFEKSHTAVAAYCSKMTHSYKAWDVIDCKLARGYLDCGGVMVKSEIAKEIGWSNTTEHSADWIYFQEIANRYSWKNFVQVKGNLFVHN